MLASDTLEQPRSAVTMLILIQPMFLVFLGVVPRLCLRLGYTTMMAVSLLLLVGILVLLCLTSP